VLGASSTIEVPGASPEEVLEYVLDLNRYKEADKKIVKVGTLTGPDESGRGRVKLSGKLRFGPAAPDVHDFVLERWSQLTFTGASGQPARMIFNFTGSFHCEPSDSGTMVTHAYEFTFRGPFRLLEPLHRRWLQDELEAEMLRVRDALQK
jgi:hypothetical protein